MKLSLSSRNAIQRNAARRTAFTLLEVLVVVAILVVMAGVASISVFRYLEDAKADRAKMDMQSIDKAYKTYYLKHGTWPAQINDPQLVSLLEQGPTALQDPWGNQYQPQRSQLQSADGQEQDRFIFTCQPPGGKPAITYPDR